MVTAVGVGCWGVVAAEDVVLGVVAAAQDIVLGAVGVLLGVRCWGSSVILTENKYIKKIKSFISY